MIIIFTNYFGNYKRSQTQLCMNSFMSINVNAGWNIYYFYISKCSNKVFKK